MSGLTQLLIRWAVLAIGVVLAEKLLPGIECRDAGTLFVVVLLLSFFNAILRPLLVLFTLPFIVLTMGLGIVVINALLFMLVGKLVEGFHVEGFWPAVGGALIVSATNFLLGGFARRTTDGGAKPPRPPASRGKRDDVIHI